MGVELDPSRPRPLQLGVGRECRGSGGNIGGCRYRMSVSILVESITCEVDVIDAAPPASDQKSQDRM